MTRVLIELEENLPFLIVEDPVMEDLVLQDVVRDSGRVGLTLEEALIVLAEEAKGLVIEIQRWAIYVRGHKLRRSNL